MSSSLKILDLFEACTIGLSTSYHLKKMMNNIFFVDEITLYFSEHSKGLSFFVASPAEVVSDVVELKAAEELHLGCC